MEVYRTTSATWPIFKHAHYLTGALSPQARCFVALVDDQPAAFASAIAMPLKNGTRIWREHRTVCLPDFQGVGIGNALSELGTRTAQDHETRLSRDGALYRLDGQKFYSTGVLFADEVGARFL